MIIYAFSIRQVVIIPPAYPSNPLSDVTPRGQALTMTHNNAWNFVNTISELTIETYVPMDLVYVMDHNHVEWSKSQSPVEGILSHYLVLSYPSSQVNMRNYMLSM